LFELFEDHPLKTVKNLQLFIEKYISLFGKPSEEFLSLVTDPNRKKLLDKYT